MNNIHNPAHTELDLSSSPEKWIEPTVEDFKIIDEHLSIKSIQLIRQKETFAPDNDSIKYYKTLTKPKLFIKLIPDAYVQSQVKATEVAQWVHHSEAKVLVSRPVTKKILKHNSSLLLTYPYIEHSFMSIDNNQICQIGTSLSLLHNALASYPQQLTVKQSGQKVHEDLLCVLNTIQSDNSMCIYGEEVILNPISGSFFNLLQANAQMIHGDLHQGNILISSQKQSPIFIDFEDSLQAWLNPSFDIAYIILRFILVNQDPKNYRSLIQDLIKSYQSSCPTNKKLADIENLFDICSLVSIRSILLLHLHRKSIGDLIFKNEMTKFINLYNLSFLSRDIIQRSLN